ncbi:MAG: S-layer homology domain-containing protein [Peptococcaceae bacterium]|nr:S-layer homology domain-containing protein [Peptococcaceae bacterium]
MPVISTYQDYSRPAGENLPAQKDNSFTPGITGKGGGLYVLKLAGTIDANALQEAYGASAEIGDALGDQALLVRVHDFESAAAVAKSFNASLEPYKVEDRIPPDAAAAVNKEKEHGTFTVTVFSPGDKTQVADLVAANGGYVIKGLNEEGRILRVKLPAGALPVLSTSPAVVYIEPYRKPGLLNDRTRDIIGAAPVAAAGFVTASGLTGAGEIVALADSGLDRGSISDIHPDLASEPNHMPKVVGLNSYSGGPTSDATGHGTHMAATIAGTGAASNGEYQGVAPGASLYVQTIMNRAGEIDPPANLVTLFLDAYEAGARIHVNGWGGRPNAYLSSASQIDRFVRYYPDFLPIFGAGNNGPGSATLTSEANSKNALIVGASQNARPVFGSESTDARALASFSSRGPTADGRIKPDLVVPGSAIISAKSSLTGGNLPGQAYYTRMQGTSMAAAVAGGAAALVREYFDQKGLKAPSAALLKALLINGARPLGFGKQNEGYGLLDLAGTLLAVEEGNFAFVDEYRGLRDGQSRSYTYEITGTGAPFKATLAWTDPPAKPGSSSTLVNDLDLTVTAPDGAVYYGNDFDRQGQADHTNNVEQVLIKDPVPGTYTVTVHAASVTVSASRQHSVTAQDFAVAFGQTVARETIKGVEKGELVLDNGEKVSTSSFTVLNVVNGRRAPASAIVPGADAYFLENPAGEQKLYVAGRIWIANGVRAIKERQQVVVTRINYRFREGGYALAPGIAGGLDVPEGSAVRACINPSTGTIWDVESGGEYRKGVIIEVDTAGRKIRLLDHDEWYELSRDAAFSVADVVVGGDPVDRAFGAASTASMDRLLPGTPVSLVLSPFTDEVTYLGAKNYVVLGRVEAVDPVKRTLELSGGSLYDVLPGVEITKDRRPVSLNYLRPGDFVFATVIPGDNSIIRIEAYSRVVYGKVLFVNGYNKLYLANGHSGFASIALTSETGIYRWGLLADTAALAPGQWVRVIITPEEDRAWRIDIADGGETVSGTLESYDRVRRRITLSGGKEFPLGVRTTVTKNGWPVRPEDLRPGEKVDVTLLRSTTEEEAAVALYAAPQPGVPEPHLSIRSSVPMRNSYFVIGETSADRLWLVYDGGRKPVNLIEQGQFYYPVPYELARKGVQFVALDQDTGGVTGYELKVPADRHGYHLQDIKGHWAENDIRALSNKGLVAGYPDGTFRPDRPVTRAEFTVFLARLLGLPAGSGEQLPFKDAADVPHWARDAVAAAYTRDLVAGFEDGTFRPGEHTTRVQAAVLLSRAYALLKPLAETPVTTPPFTDWQQVPGWAREDVARAYTLGIFRGRHDNSFGPSDFLTRAETAAVLNRFLEAIGQDQLTQPDIDSEGPGDSPAGSHNFLGR